MKRVYQKEEVCIGCRLCEIGCIVEHSPSKNAIKAFRNVQPRPESRNIVEEKGPPHLFRELPPLRRAGLRPRLHRGGHSQGPRYGNRHPGPGQMRRLLVMHNGLPLRGGPEKQLRGKGHEMRPVPRPGEARHAWMPAPTGPWCLRRDKQWIT